MTYIVIYLVLINLLGFFVMFIDKRRAIKRKYRIKEFTLWMISLIGGALGSTLAMYLFRHKTKHMTFVIGLPILVISHLAFVSYLLNNISIN